MGVGEKPARMDLADHVLERILMLRIKRSLMKPHHMR